MQVSAVGDKLMTSQCQHLRSENYVWSFWLVAKLLLVKLRYQWQKKLTYFHWHLRPRVTSTSLHKSDGFYRASAYWRAIADLSVCLSVRYVPVPYKNGLTYRHSFFSPYGSTIIIVLQHQTFSQNSDGVTPCGVLNTGVVEKFRGFLPISRYISQTIQNIAIVTMEGE